MLRDSSCNRNELRAANSVARIPSELPQDLHALVEAVPDLVLCQLWAAHSVEDAFFDIAPSNCQDAIMINNELGDLGWGWKSFKKIGKVAYRVAAMPVTLATKAANATSKVLCSGGGVQGNSKDARTAQAFCKAVRVKDAVAARRLLPAATAVASKAASATKTSATYNVVAQHYGANNQVSGSDMELLAGLAGADEDSLAFALAGVDPTEIGAAVTTSELIAFAPAILATGIGAWLVFRG